MMFMILFSFAIREFLLGNFCNIVFTSETVGLLVLGKVEGILIIPLEKWKFVHKLRWKKGCDMLKRKIDSYLKD